MTVYSSHLYKNIYLSFSFLFFLLNLICDIFSLFISIILSTNLLTELRIDDQGYIIKRLNISLSHLREFLRDVMPVSVVIWPIGIGKFNFRFFAKLNKPKFQLNSNGMEVSFFSIFCILIVLIICGDIELNPGPRQVM